MSIGAMPCEIFLSQKTKLPKKYVLEEADEQVRGLEAGPRK